MIEKIYPFEYVIDNGKESIFVERVKRILNRDIVSRNSLGCRINDCHTHIGAKKHLSQFIEAELLFKNSYYTKGFAYLTFQRIVKEITDEKARICIVGYENISEIYLAETKTLFEEYNKNNNKKYEVEYAIYNNDSFVFSTEENWFEKNNKTIIVFVVPISTTMTTMDKIVQKYTDRIKTKYTKTIRLALIVIAPNEENDCWEVKSGNGGREIYIKGEGYSIIRKEDAIDYFILLSNDINWWEPNKCPDCFPDKNIKENENALKGMLEEKALFEVNKESTVPMLQLFNKTIRRRKNGIDENENRKKVLFLLDYMEHHRHIIRNHNHFQFYFDTRKYFEGIINNNKEKKKFLNWCESIKDSLFLKSDNSLYYDIIVAPKHFSNSEFVHYINEEVFDGEARLLMFDVFKEFRENIMLKYSDLNALAEYMKKNENDSVLRFHYVDDSIISGESYIKIKSWLISLLPPSSDIYKNDIFSSIIILVGRNSIGSKNSFVGENYSYKGLYKWMNPNNENRFYYEYVHFNVSSMRHHDDACTLCKVCDNNNKVKDLCATDCVYRNLDMAKNKYKPISFSVCENNENKSVTNEEIQDKKEAEDEKWIKEHAMCAMILHDLNTNLENKKRYLYEFDKFDTNDPKDVFQLLIKMYEKETTKEGKQYELSPWDQNYELYKIAFVKAISRPFFTYGKSYRQAALTFCLKQLDELLINKEIEEKDIELIKTYINALSDLNSVYLLREKVVEKIISIKEKGLNNSNLFVHYLTAIKRLISLSSDDSRGELLENIIVKGSEAPFFDKDDKTNNNPEVRNRRLLLYFENNKVIKDGLNEKAALKGSSSLDYYYMRGLKSFFEINSIDEETEEIIFNNYLDIKAQLKKEKNNSAPVRLNNQNADFTEVLKNISKPINNLINCTICENETVLIDMFLVDKNNNEMYLCSNEEYNERFYNKENLNDLNNIIIDDNTFYHEDGENRIVFRIGGENGLYFSIITKDKSESLKKINEWFGIKVLLTLRGEILDFLERYDINDEIRRIEIEKRSKALVIPKAFTHSDKTYFEGQEYHDYLINISKNATNIDELRQWLKDSNDRYLMKISNDYMSAIYREMVKSEVGKKSRKEDLYAGGFDYWEDYLINQCGFDKNDEGEYIRVISTSFNKTIRKVKIICKKLPKENDYIGIKTYFKVKLGVDIFPVICRLIYVFAMNVATHCGEYYSPEDIIDFNVEIKNEFVIFSNKIMNSNYEKKTTEEIAKEISNKVFQKINVYPWETKQPSITLWTFNTYYDLLKSKGIDDKRISIKLGNVDLEEAVLEEADLKEADEFIIKLPIITREENDAN